MAEVESKRIREIYISDFGGTSIVSGKLSDGRKFETTVPNPQFNELVQDYAERGIININYDKPQQTSVWLSVLPSAALIVLVIVFFFIFTQQTQGGGSRVMSFVRAGRASHRDKKK